MHIVNSFDIRFEENRIAQFPDSEWPALEKALNTVFCVLEDEFWSLTRVRHALEESRLDLLIDNLTLELAVKVDSCSSGINLNVVFECDAIASIAQSTHLLNIDLVKTGDNLAPCRRMLNYAS